MSSLSLQGSRKSASFSAIAIAAALAVTAVAPSAMAASPTLSGWGARGNASFMGSLTLMTTGEITGNFTIVVADPPGEQPTVCRYTSFRARSVSGPKWDFDAAGTCWSAKGAFDAYNHIFIGDYGAGNAIDGVDINDYGAMGVAVPGGILDDGDFTASF